MGLKLTFLVVWGTGDGAVVRAPASTQCGLGSIPGLGVVCGLKLLLIPVPALRGFSLRVLQSFPSTQKPTLINSNLI